MKVYSNIRDFVHDDQPLEPARTPDEELAGVSLPGDPVYIPYNPYIGKNPQSLLKLLSSNTLDKLDVTLVREAISTFELFSGEKLSGGMIRCTPNVESVSEVELKREIDQDILENPHFDPELAGLFR